MPVFYDDQLRPALVAALDRQTAQLTKLVTVENTQTQMQQTIALLLGEMVKSQERIAQTLNKIYLKAFPVPQPGLMSFAITQENGSMLVAKITLPEWPTTPSDIVKGVANVNVAGSGADQDVAVGTTELTVSGNDGESCAIRFSYVDDAGNVGPASVLEFTFSDTLPPPAPGVMSFTITEET